MGVVPRDIDGFAECAGVADVAVVRARRPCEVPVSWKRGRGPPEVFRKCTVVDMTAGAGTAGVGGIGDAQATEVGDELVEAIDDRVAVGQA